MLVSVSYLNEENKDAIIIKNIESSKADFIHVDLRDGAFVPKKNFTIPKLNALLGNHELPLDIHMMTFDPIIYIKDLAKLNPNNITFHIEATKDVVGTIEAIKKEGIKVGLALKPDTDLLELMPYLCMIDLVLIMSVTPGASGQPFIENSVSRLQELLKIRKENNYNFKIAMDGGLNADTIKLVKDLDIAVSSSFVTGGNNYNERIDMLKS